MEKESNKQKKFIQHILSFFKKDKESAIPCEKEKLLYEIEEAISDLRYARNCFKEAHEPEMIEACIYEIKSAEARYSFLLRKAKRLAEANSEMTV